MWIWLSLAGLGAFHGVNPAMGWLFAAAIGLQRRSRAAILRALVPIALGHAIAVGLTLVAVVLLRTVVDLEALKAAAAILLVAFGLNMLIARHRGRAGMQVGSLDLVLWSFLMATAHGAGVMLLPILLDLPAGPHAGHGMPPQLGRSALEAVIALGVHTAAMIAVSAAIAVAVYSWIGLAILRRGWLNFDRLWALALIAIGALSLAALLA